MEPENDDLIAQFVSITGANPVDAMQYLEMSEGDMQRAVDLYLDMGSTVNQGGSPAAAGASTAGHSGLFEEDVREAIPARYDQLIGGTNGPFESMQGWLHANANIPSLAELEAQAAQDEFEEAGLGSLYRPPEDINSGGSFQEAMKRAKEVKKWLIVNIQAADEFASHVLNRDIWSHETVKEMIRSSFVFWQREKGSQQGAQVVNNYNLVQFPVVLIIDPRTGRKVKLWTSEKLRGPLSVTDLLVDFMGENPYSSSTASRHHSVDATPPLPVEEEEVVEVKKLDADENIPSTLPTEYLALPGGDSDGVKVAIRLLNGQKKQVSFKADSPLGVVKDWVSATESIAAKNIEIRLSHPPKPLDFHGDPNATVGNTGIAGALLVVVAIVPS